MNGTTLPSDSDLLRRWHGSRDGAGESVCRTRSSEPRRERAIDHNGPSIEPRVRSPNRWAWFLAALAWCGLIAGTSSTVILPHDMFAWVASRVLTGRAAFRAFVAFWGHSWFAIVKG